MELVNETVLRPSGDTDTTALCVSRSELTRVDLGMADTLANAYGNTTGSVMVRLVAGTVTSLHWPVGTVWVLVKPGAVMLKLNEPWTYWSDPYLHSSNVPVCVGGVGTLVTVSVVRPEPTVTMAKSMGATTPSSVPPDTEKVGEYPATGDPGDDACSTRIVEPTAAECLGPHVPGVGSAVSA